MDEQSGDRLNYHSEPSSIASLEDDQSESLLHNTHNISFLDIENQQVDDIGLDHRELNDEFLISDKTFISELHISSNERINLFINNTINFLHKAFISGPQVKVDPIYQCTITSKFAALDRFPFRIYASVSLKTRMVALALYLIVWLFVVMPMILKNLYSLPEITTKNIDRSDFNLNNTDIVQLSCRQFHNIWEGKSCSKCLNAGCCLGDLRKFDKPMLLSTESTTTADLVNYSPYTVDDRDIIIKCPALCDSESKIYSTMTTGLETHKYISYVVGGGLIEDIENYEHLTHSEQITYPYRADSFPCAAALHAGLISATHGGSARMSFVSSNDKTITSFDSKKGKYFSSVGFNSTFPYSFIFKSLKDSKNESGFEIIVKNCYDYRMRITLVNILFGIPLMYFYEGVIDYVVISIMAFWNIILALDPPIILDNFNPEATSYLFSVGFRRLLPLAFVLYTIWRMAVKSTLNKNASPIGKILLWYFLFWVSIMNNLTFDKYLTVDRLLISDLKGQISSILTVLIIGSILIVCVLIQTFAVWRTGKLVKYLSFYFTVIISCVLLNKIPGVTLRIHHYIFGLILIPGTYTRGFSALLFQGLLLGFIINGVARWDFASIVETDGSLRRDDPFYREDLRPPVFNDYDRDLQALSWIESASMFNIEEQDYDDINPNILDGFSLIINDIERYRGVNSTIYIPELIKLNPDFREFVETSVAAMDGKPLELYLRVARASTTMVYRLGDYTNAAVLTWPSGEFIMPKPGVS
ncbi:hypothetical protein DASC09_018190 [Saccharomycopsis crataegensis]|uniref:LCCL domain-containing protein n=1 Tax=Saccharomycopsis crataegensis TaxID=43959 RepID=A0AAV5QID8_9ASCO|nr:hypothetical protein DASC09_018190 [Saccharomycopsis crataegensis]